MERKELKLHRGAHNSKELIDQNGWNYVAHVMKEECADEIVRKVNGFPFLLDVVERVKASMEAIPWSSRPASWDCYIKEFDSALKSVDPK
jgi:hypothetical protein